jgi:branched-chain amino acid transport system ATP-binding protein
LIGDSRDGWTGGKQREADVRILEVVGLTCRVGRVAVLDALSFTVEEGEIFALCGPAGAGKTIGLRCLTGSLPFESGRLIYDGREITGTDPRERARQGLVRVGEISTPPWSLAVMEAITLARRWPRWGPFSAVVARWPGADGGARDVALLERVGLAADARRRRDALSAVELARLELAQALALAPRLLLLDGPLGRLPLEDRPSMAALITSLRASGATIVLTEREPAVAEAVADRVATLDRGALVR